MHDDAAPRHQACEQPRVADVADNKFRTVGEKPCDVLQVVRVGKLVKHGDVNPGMFLDYMAHKVAADKAASAGDNDILGSKFSAIAHHSSTQKHSTAQPDIQRRKTIEVLSRRLRYYSPSKAKNKGLPF